MKSFSQVKPVLLEYWAYSDKIQQHFNNDIYPKYVLVWGFRYAIYAVFMNRIEFAME